MDARLTDKFIGEKMEKRATGEKDEGEHFVRLIIPLRSCTQLLCAIFFSCKSLVSRTDTLFDLIKGSLNRISLLE